MSEDKFKFTYENIEYTADVAQNGSYLLLTSEFTAQIITPQQIQGIPYLVSQNKRTLLAALVHAYRKQGETNVL
jgi:hypothetical protein